MLAREGGEQRERVFKGLLPDVPCERHDRPGPLVARC